MKQRIITDVTEAQIKEQIQQAKALVESGETQYPDDNFEDGVIATLEWIFGGAVAPLMEELHRD